jgi:hypothetical protein
LRPAPAAHESLRGARPMTGPASEAPSAHEALSATLRFQTVGGHTWCPKRGWAGIPRLALLPPPSPPAGYTADYVQADGLCPPPPIPPAGDAADGQVPRPPHAQAGPHRPSASLPESLPGHVLGPCYSSRFPVATPVRVKMGAIVRATLRVILPSVASAHRPAGIAPARPRAGTVAGPPQPGLPARAAWPR